MSDKSNSAASEDDLARFALCIIRAMHPSGCPRHDGGARGKGLPQAPVACLHQSGRAVGGSRPTEGIVGFDDRPRADCNSATHRGRSAESPSGDPDGGGAILTNRYGEGRSRAGDRRTLDLARRDASQGLEHLQAPAMTMLYRSATSR
jgi:hypothetical protein